MPKTKPSPPLGFSPTHRGKRPAEISSAAKVRRAPKHRFSRAAAQHDAVSLRLAGRRRLVDNARLAKLDDPPMPRDTTLRHIAPGRLTAALVVVARMLVLVRVSECVRPRD